MVSRSVGRLSERVVQRYREKILNYMNGVNLTSRNISENVLDGVLTPKQVTVFMKRFMQDRVERILIQNYMNWKKVE